MMTIKFTIPGPPKGKARPQVVRKKNGDSNTYTPDPTVAYEELVRSRFIKSQDAAGWAMTEAPIRAIIFVGYPIPKSTSKKKRAAMMAGEIRPTKMPDCDNIAKIIFDALNGFAYKDDKQIVYMAMTKKYVDGAGEVVVQMHEVANHE